MMFKLGLMLLYRHQDHGNPYTFNWGGSVSEFQSIITIMGSMVARRQIGSRGISESSTSYRQQEIN